MQKTAVEHGAKMQESKVSIEAKAEAHKQKLAEKKPEKTGKSEKSKKTIKVIRGKDGRIAGAEVEGVE